MAVLRQDHSHEASSNKGSTLRENDRQWLEDVAVSNGFGRKQKLQNLSPPPRPNFIPNYETESVYGEARDHLARLYPQTPSKSLKTIFQSSKKKDAQADQKQWEFSLNERADALDTVINLVLSSSDAADRERQLRLTQAILDNEHTDALIRKWSIQTSKSFTKKTENVIPEIPSTWLQEAAQKRDTHLVNLLASRQMHKEDSIDTFVQYRQHILDEALNRAFSSPSNNEVIRLLLSYGANPNTSAEYFEYAMNSGNTGLVQLLLQAPNTLHPLHVSNALIKATRLNDKSLVPLLLAYSADRNEGKYEALCSAIEIKNIGAIAAILSLGVAFIGSHHIDCAINLLLQDDIQDPKIGFILNMLLRAGASRNTDELQAALAKASHQNDENLVSMLMSYDTSPDRNEGEAITLAVKNLSIHLLDILIKGYVSEKSATEAINAIPIDANEEQVEKILKALITKKPSSQSLGQLIFHAVEKNWVQLVKWMVEHGASIQQQGIDLRPDVPSIRLALKPYEQEPFREGCLKHLLGPHTHVDPEVLCQILPLALQIKSRSARLRAMSTILRKGVAGDDLHLMLQSLIVEEGHVDDKLIQLLLQNRASINYVGLDGRNCIEMAAKRGHSKMIELLCHPGQTNQSHIDSTILSKAFESCINLQQDRRFSTAKQLLDLCVSVNTIDTQLRKIVMDNDIDLLRLMLHSRNKAPLQDTEVLIIAIRTGNIDLIRLLLQSSLTSNVVNTAFTKAIEKNLLANTQIGIGTGELLLQTNQIRHENINNALIHVVQNYGLPTRDQFVDLLLQHKADVNWQSAAVIKEAARNPEPDLFKKLLQYGARTNLVILALIHLAAANKWSEKSLLERLRICIRPIDDALEQRDGNIIIMAMFNFPNGTQLVKLLLKEGWSPNYKALCKIEENEEEEIVPALLWAICQRNIINTSVIKELLNAGATVQCMSPRTKASPLTEAAKQGRSDLVVELVQRGAKVDFRDVKKRSPLYYCCGHGDLTSASLLLEHGAKSNDGSIHIAAEYCHVEVISKLLKCGYDPNHLHSGKTALVQLCHNYQPRGEDWEEKIRESIKLLLENGADPMIKLKSQNGKTALHLALENSLCSIQILNTLLEYSEIAKRVDDDIFRFIDSKGLYYSPTKYLEYFCENVSSDTKKELIRLLHEQNCEDRYYNPKGEQPERYCGLPPELEEFDQHFRRQQTLVQIEMDTIRQKHRLTMDLADEMETTEQDRGERKQSLAMRRSQQKHEQTVKQSSEIHRVQLDYEYSQAQQRQNFKEKEQRGEIAHNQMLKQIEETERSKELTHAGALSTMRRREQQEVINMQRQMITDQENAAIRAHKRDKERMNYQTEQTKIQAKEMKAVAAAASSANVPPRLLTQGLSSLSLPSPD